jgi:hypothetical protein
MNLNILSWWTNHGTKILGVAQGTVAALSGVAGIIPEHQLKYYLAASALLTVWRGFTNSAAQAAPAK